MRIFLWIVLALFLSFSCNTTADTSGIDQDLLEDRDTSYSDDDREVDERGDADSVRQDEDDADFSDSGDDSDTDIDSSDTGSDIAITVVCENTLSTDSGKCEITAEGSENPTVTIFHAKYVLEQKKIVENGYVAIKDGVIICTGCDCLEQSDVTGGKMVSCPTEVLSPGIINAHDHISYDQNFPGDWGDERFNHRHEWRIGLNGHTELDVPRSSAVARVAWSELRQMISGTTSMAGSGEAPGLLRNVDRNDSLIGVKQGGVRYQTFPFGDTNGTMLTTTCNYPSTPYESSLHAHCFFPHVAEGLTAAARNEFLCLNGVGAGAVDGVNPNSAFVHGVGMTAEDGKAIADENTAIIWSPRSNISLYGNTAQVTMYHRQGVIVGLGTDWTASGSMNMLREMACVTEYNNRNLHSYFTARDVWLMATWKNALALRISEGVGAIKEGLTADISIFALNGKKDPYESVVFAELAGVELVVLAGVPQYGDAALMDALVTDCALEAMSVCEVDKKVCLEETGKTMEDLIDGNTESYPLFFCTPPPDEPSCLPMRPKKWDPNPYTGVPTDDDSDGDGVLNKDDNCPYIFNPIRSLDSYVQADGDDDGVGDACDLCPTDTNLVTCAILDIDDQDGDGVKDLVDNCPFVENADQLDTDKDEIGDVCDDCPTDANPGFSLCPLPETTIYDLNNGTVAMDSIIRTRGVVTESNAEAFAMQMTPDIAGWDTTEKEKFGGIYVYTQGSVNKPKRGDEVMIQGKILSYYDLREMQDIIHMEVITNHDVPEPILVSIDDIKNGGSLADTYTSVLVKIENTTITSLESYGEFKVDGKLRVDEFFYGYKDQTVGTTFSTLAGVLTYNFSNFKLLPRDSKDMVVAP
ncbi:amidohydrolase family protein [bacterium]|nr:amidohydrolase family protein [bacterium]